MKRIIAFSLLMLLLFLNSCSSECEHTYGEYQYNESSHWRSYTCGHTAPNNASEHSDADGDGACDTCKYSMNKNGGLNAPEIHFLRTYVDWLNEITEEDISQIALIKQAVGVAPGNLKTVRVSTDRATISSLFEKYYWAETSIINKEDTQISGGSMLTVEFLLNDGSVKSLNIHSGTFRDGKGNYLALRNAPVFSEGDSYAEYIGFITHSAKWEIYDIKNDDSDSMEKIGEIENPEMLCFVPCDCRGETEAMYYIKTEFSPIYVYGPYQFSYDGKFYELKNGNFYDMLGINM